jgi:hypothetical protein
MNQLPHLENGASFKENPSFPRRRYGSESKCGRRLFLPDAFRRSSAGSWQVHKMRHGFGAGGHPLRTSSAHGQPPIAFHNYGRTHGGSNGDYHDVDEVIAYFYLKPPNPGAWSCRALPRAFSAIYVYMFCDRSNLQFARRARSEHSAGARR